MSIINEALKKAGKEQSGSNAAPQQEGGASFRKAVTVEVPKKKQKMNWGPVFVLMVLVLITGPLVAPIFSSPYRNTAESAFLVPSYQQTLAQQQSGSENRKGQFAIEESPILPAQGQVIKNFAAELGGPAGQPNFFMNGIVYAIPESYCLINGKVVKIGDKIDGATLKSVTPEKAELEYHGNRIDLWVNH